MASTLPSLTQDQFAQRMLANFPPPWSGDAAKAPGGVLYALFEAIASQLQVLFGGIQAVQSELYTLQTTFPQLALINQSAATRQALQNGVKQITGIAPRMIEPWNPGDTGAFDTTASYLDVDNAQNPCLLADPSLRYQGFIVSTFAPVDINAQTNRQPLQTFDDSAYWEVPGYGFLPLQVNLGSQPVLQAVQALHAEGTVVWVKFVQHL